MDRTALIGGFYNVGEVGTPAAPPVVYIATVGTPAVTYSGLDIWDQNMNVT